MYRSQIEIIDEWNAVFTYQGKDYHLPAGAEGKLRKVISRWPCQVHADDLTDSMIEKYLLNHKDQWVEDMP